MNHEKISSSTVRLSLSHCIAEDTGLLHSAWRAGRSSRGASTHSHHRYRLTATSVGLNDAAEKLRRAQIPHISVRVGATSEHRHRDMQLACKKTAKSRLVSRKYRDFSKSSNRTLEMLIAHEGGTVKTR